MCISCPLVLTGASYYIIIPFGRLGPWSTEELSNSSKCTELVSEPRQTDLKLHLPRMTARSDILAQPEDLSIQSFRVARKDGSRKTGKEIIGLQGSRAGQGACPLPPLPGPSQCPKTIYPMKTQGMLMWGGLPLPQVEWLVPDGDYFALDKDLGYFLGEGQSMLFNLNFGWCVFGTGGTFKARNAAVGFRASTSRQCFPRA